MHRFLALVSSTLTGLVVLVVVAFAAPPNTINSSFNALCDAWFPDRCVSVIPDPGNKGGGLVVSGNQTAVDNAPLTNALKTWSLMAGYDGVTMDMVRVGDVNNGASAVGYLDTLAIGRYNATLPTLTDARFNAMQLDIRGNLNVGLVASGTNTPILGGSSAVDAIPVQATGNHLRVVNVPTLFNGTTFDRERSAIDALNSNGLGIPAAGLVGQCDDTAPVAITENQFGNARINCTDHSQIVSGDKPASSDAVPATSTTMFTTAFNMVFNGTTWDRLKEIVSGLNSPGLGIIAAGQLGQCDDVSPVAITENNFGDVRINCTDHSQVISGNGSAGTPAAGVVSVQGVTNGTPIGVGSGTAGVPATAVVTVQGIPGGIPLVTTTSGGSTAVDGASLINALRTWAILSVFNGVTTDNVRSIANGVNSNGIGVPSAGLMGQCDDTTPVALTENNFGAIRMNCTDHSLLTSIVGGSLNAKASAADPTYVEASNNPLSLNLAGYQRVIVPSSQLLVVGSPGVPAAQVVSMQGVAGGNPMAFSQTGGVPIVQITGNANGTTGAVVGTLAAVAAKTTYICGFTVNAAGGTASVGPIVLAGIVGSSMTFQGFSSAAGFAMQPMNFNPCLPASAVNTPITITTVADATATAVNVNSWGYQQ